MHFKGFNSTKNIITAKSITQRGPHNNEKTTEGILKAARLGDLKMLAELHREGRYYNHATLEPRKFYKPLLQPIF